MDNLFLDLGAGYTIMFTLRNISNYTRMIFVLFYVYVVFQKCFKNHIVWAGFAKIAFLFFFEGANVNRATANNDHTVVSLACAGGHLAVVELLLAHGADPTHRLKVFYFKIRKLYIIIKIYFRYFSA